MFDDLCQTATSRLKSPHLSHHLRFRFVFVLQLIVFILHFSFAHDLCILKISHIWFLSFWITRAVYISACTIALSVGVPQSFITFEILMYKYFWFGLCFECFVLCSFVLSVVLIPICVTSSRMSWAGIPVFGLLLPPPFEHQPTYHATLCRY